MKALGYSRFIMPFAAFFACAGTVFAAQVNTAVEVPFVITEKAYLWLDAADASSFTLDSDGRVEKWSDKSGNGNDAVAYVEGDVTARGTVGLTNGVPAFLMGEVGSGIDLKFATDLSGVQAVFQVVDIVPDSADAPFIGDANNLFERGTEGQIFKGDWKRAGYGVTFKQDGVASEDVIVGGDNVAKVATTTFFGAGTHVYTWIRNGQYTSSVQINTLSGSSGGRAVSEVLLFRDVLTAAQVAEIEAYLIEKWMREPVKPLVPAFLTKDDVHLWLDAAESESFTLDASGKVETWADKSGNGNDAVAYEQAGATDGDKGIWERGTVGETNGVPAFLMGEAGSGIDLKFPADANIRTVFQVMDWVKTSSNAWFLANTKDVRNTVKGYEAYGRIDFQRGGVSSTGNAYMFANNWRTSDWALWFNNDHIRNGLIRFNKAQTAALGTEMFGGSGSCIYSLVTTDAASADCLSGDRVGLGKSETAGVSGGKAVSELIVIDRALSEREVYAVENYLYVKWRPGDAKAKTTLSTAQSLAAGDSFPNLVLANGAALTVDFTDVAKGGTLCTVYGRLTKTATEKITISASSSIVRECALLKCAASEGISADSFELDSALAAGYSLVWADNTLSLVRRPGFRIVIR